MMSINIFHASDLHGQLHYLSETDFADQADLFLLTGDMLPNKPSKYKNIIKEQEKTFQENWFHNEAKESINKFKAVVGNKPVFYVNGNHDFVDLGLLLNQAGFKSVVAINQHNLVYFNGVTFAGFGHIPYIRGEWNDELQYKELDEVVDKALRLCPDVLVTHAGPYGILDEEKGYGIRPLSMKLQYNPNLITFKHHFFGHCHQDGGKTVEYNGIKFYNGAVSLSLHTIT